MAIERTGKAKELFEKADKLYMKDDNAGAVAMYSEVIKLLPDDWESYDIRAAAYRELGNWDKAAADTEKMLELNPNPEGSVPGRYWELGDGFEKTGNKNKAIEYYQKSLELGDFNGYSQKALARLGAASGNMNSGNVEFR
jgi:tetratricopeptide (TPR) repeat protein